MGKRAAGDMEGGDSEEAKLVLGDRMRKVLEWLTYACESDKAAITAEVVAIEQAAHKLNNVNRFGCE